MFIRSNVNGRPDRNVWTSFLALGHWISEPSLKLFFPNERSLNTKWIDKQQRNHHTELEALFQEGALLDRIYKKIFIRPTHQSSCCFVLTFTSNPLLWHKISSDLELCNVANHLMSIESKPNARRDNVNNDIGLNYIVIIQPRYLLRMHYLKTSYHSKHQMYPVRVIGC